MDVLSCYADPNHQPKVALQEAALRRAGLSCTTIYCDQTMRDSVGLEAVISSTEPAAVINRAFTFRAPALRPVLNSRGTPQIITCNHSSLAYCWSGPGYCCRQHAELIRLTNGHRNCWYATPDERVPLAPLGPRFICLPNLIEQPLKAKARVWGGRLVLCCRNVPEKNLGNQLAALALLARRSAVDQIAILWKDPPKFAGDLVNAYGIASLVRVLNWGERASWLSMINNFDLGLHVSFSDSFGYVPLELMRHGIPVCGGPAIRYLPASWRAAPDDPASICETLVDIIDHYADASGQALAIHSAMHGRLEAAFVAIVRSIVEANPNF